VTDSIIKIENVAKEYKVPDGKNVKALDGVSLEVSRNEFVCLVGPSGCGKTTLLNIVAGLEPFDSGKVTMHGEDIIGPGPERGVIFQQYALFPWMTVRKNIEYGMKFLRNPNGSIRYNEQKKREIAEYYIKMVNLLGFEDSYPKALSGGMKQRVAIARALVNDPRALLMDEPFGALDAQTRNIMQSELLRIWEEKRKTVVFVTHSVDEAIYLADRIVIMSARPGRIKDIIEISLPRPRNRTSSEVNRIRDRILSDLRSEMGTS